MENNNILATVERQRTFFNTGATRSVAYRIKHLKALQKLVRARETDILAAIRSDLGKGTFESYACEILMVLNEFKDAIAHTAQRSRLQRKRAGLFCFPSRASVYHDPYGVVLIMSPWNYPFNLTLSPLIAALSAGNTVVVKPSNYSPATSRIIQELLEAVYPPEYVTVVQGGHEANTTLLDCYFNYIFFTGSPSVGKIVMQKASEHLTPITLELGGKSPCIIDETTDIQVTARRIVWGKMLNAGQTCIAPDFLFVQDTVKDALIHAVQQEITNRYNKPLTNSEFPHIISKRHFDRAVSLLTEAKKNCSVYGGAYDSETLKMEPAIIDHAHWDDVVMQEELFCPLIPVITWHDKQEIFDRLLERPSPLALYVFSRDKKLTKDIVKLIPFGGGCINDVILHITAAGCPFGGVGNSGMGNYHGAYGFSTFSREKTVIRTPQHIDIAVRYAPFSESKYQFIRKLFK